MSVFYKCVVAYDGTHYKGWQKQKKQEPTIQSKIEQVLSKLFGESIEIHGSGRTDAGVHAHAQVFSFEASRPYVRGELMDRLNKFLPKDISVRSVEVLEGRFHARYGAIEKCYVYRIWKAPYPPVFERPYVMVHDGNPLSVREMEKAVPYLVGKRDFKAFSTDKTKKSTLRHLKHIEIESSFEEITIRFIGDGFLYNMVRILTGTLIEVGLGVRAIEDLPSVLESCIRANAGFTAPPEGLSLAYVTYK